MNEYGLPIWMEVMEWLVSVTSKVQPFLDFMFQEGLQYRSINLIRSAVLYTYLPADGTPIVVSIPWWSNCLKVYTIEGHLNQGTPIYGIHKLYRVISEIPKAFVTDGDSYVPGKY